MSTSVPELTQYTHEEGRERNLNREDKVIFCLGGTSEGRFLADTDLPLVYSTLTQAGCDRVTERAGLTRRHGALPYSDLMKAFEDDSVAGVVDATHPYAASISKNALKAAHKAHKPICRFARRSSYQELSHLQTKNPAALVIVADERKAAQWLKQHTTANQKILMATGAFHLTEYKDAGLIDRLVVRALDGPESIKKAQDLGLSADQLILGRGPYSFEANCVHLTSAGADVLVTKESGSVGGFHDKIRAALTCGIPAVVIARPQEDKDAYDLYTDNGDDIYRWCVKMLKQED